MKGHLTKQGKTKTSPWYAVLDEYDASGKRKRRWVSLNTASKHEAEDRLHKLLAEAQDGGLPRNSRLTVAEFLRAWLDDVKAPRLRLRSIDGYRDIIEKHLVPAFGQTRLAALRPEHIQAYYARLVSEGGGDGPLAAQTVLHHHTMLRAALKHAVRTGLLPRNPTDAVEAPRPVRHETRTLAAEEAAGFVEAIAGSRWHVFVALALTTGMRRGELCGLRWSDVGFENGRLAVRQTVARVRGKGLVFEPTKSRRSERPIAVSSAMCELLRAHRGQQEEERQEAQPLWQDHSLVFPRPDGRPMDPTAVSHEFSKLLEKVGLSHVRLHDLRHTMATLLLEAGVHPKVVQERAGHATIGITLDLYSHVQPTIQEEAARRIEAAVLRGTASGRTAQLSLTGTEVAALEEVRLPGESIEEAATRVLRFGLEHAKRDRDADRGWASTIGAVATPVVSTGDGLLPKLLPNSSEQGGPS